MRSAALVSCLCACTCAAAYAPPALRSRPCHMRLDFGQDDGAELPNIPYTPETPPAALRQREVADLVAWVESNGGEASGVAAAPALDGTGLGLVATRAANGGNDLLTVPIALGISAESALRSTIGVYLAEFEPELGDFALIALSLMHERRLGDISDYAPWLSRCPTLLPPLGFPDLPLLWESEALAELEAATTAGAARRLAAVEADFRWLETNVFADAPVVFPPAIFSKAAFTAAVAVVVSRSVPIAMAGGEEEEEEVAPVLLPLLDLINHDSRDPAAKLVGRAAKGAGIFGGSAAPASASLVASKTVAEGDTLCVRYGGSTSGELLLDHGFLDEPVPAVAPLCFAIDENELNFDEKDMVLEGVGLPIEATWLIGEDDAEGLPDELLAFLRLKHLGGADAFLLESIFADSVWTEHLQLPVSEENERAAIGDVASSVDAALAQLAAGGGSVQRDLQTLAEASKASRQYKLAAVRYAERRALQAAARTADALLGQLGGLEYYQQRRLNSLGLQPIETDEELDALRAAGRRSGASDVEW